MHHSLSGRSRRASLGVASLACTLAALSGCHGDSAGPPNGNAVAAELRALTAGRQITALERAPAVRPALVKLGRALAFDKVLSGNHDISCMTCHLPRFATSDAHNLSIGAGATGLGTARVGAFIARNSPPAFNLTAMTSFFWDGRVEIQNGAYHTPAGDKLTGDMTQVFEFGALSAQPMFPVTSHEEMRGTTGNELAPIADDQPQLIWQGLMARLGTFPAYRQMFEAAYPGKNFDDMNFAYASNAIAGFLVDRFQFNQSPWDHFLAGDDNALSDAQLRGGKAFMTAKCSVCHNGAAFSDNLFHNVAVPQIGPGEGDGADGKDDFGRMRVTGNAHDKYAFRTSPLRNVELTAPYGHDGAFADLRSFVAHYSESDLKLHSYDVSQLDSRLQGSLQPTASDILATRDTLLNGVVFTEQQIDDVTAFMLALTDPTARNLDGVVPASVPSGLPVDH